MKHLLPAIFLAVLMIGLYYLKMVNQSYMCFGAMVVFIGLWIKVIK